MAGKYQNTIEALLPKCLVTCLTKCGILGSSITHGQ
jgi:hypothetical protein